MSKTLINGTAYEIDHGNTLIGGTQYVIDHGNTKISGTDYKIEFYRYKTGWPGWDNATWEDINNLCYAKQQGYINSWPSDVILGATKDADITYKRFSDTYTTATVTWRIVDLDKDANGTITFDTSSTLMVYDSPSSYRTTMADMYDRFSIKDYLVEITKMCGRNAGTERALYMWDPSIEEIGLSKSGAATGYYTKDVSSRYSYYTDSTTRSKSSSWVSRTQRDSDSYSQVEVAANGTVGNFVGNDIVQSNRTIMFAVGNPSAQTLE